MNLVEVLRESTIIRSKRAREPHLNEAPNSSQTKERNNQEEVGHGRNYFGKTGLNTDVRADDWLICPTVFDTSQPLEFIQVLKYYEKL